MEVGPLKKDIRALPKDIYDIFEKDVEFSEDEVRDFADSLAAMLARRVTERKGVPTLRMSALGTPHRKLWYEINHPELGEPLTGKERFKFLYGDILEHLLLFLAKKSGHEVYDGQEELEIDGVLGHRDAIIDGITADVKSASPYGFKKFAFHLLAGDDPFGYLDQINAYRDAGKDDPRIEEKDKVAFVAVEKVSGDIAVDIYDSNGVDYSEKIAELREMLARKEPPDRCHPAVPDGKSGNLVLGTQCSYCAFKRACWPGLKVFQYSTGPKFFVRVAKPPRVEEASW